MKYHALFVIFEKAAKFAIVVHCKLQVALYGLECHLSQALVDRKINLSRILDAAEVLRKVYIWLLYSEFLAHHLNSIPCVYILREDNVI